MKPLRQRHNQVIEQVQADANIMATSYQKVIAVMEAHIAHLKAQLAQPRVGCLECDFTGLLDVGQVDVMAGTGEIVQRPYRVLCPACRPMLTKFIDDYLCWMQGGSDANSSND